MSLASRKAAYADGKTELCNLPCVECLGEYAKGNLDIQYRCQMPQDKEPFFANKVDGKSYYQCKACFNGGKKCHALPLADFDDLQFISRLFRALDHDRAPPAIAGPDATEEETEAAEREWTAYNDFTRLRTDAPGAIKSRAERLYLTAVNLARKGGFGSHFHRHNGETDIDEKCAQSGIMVAGRDRSKVGQKRKAREEDDYIAGNINKSPRKGDKLLGVFTTDLERTNDGSPPPAAAGNAFQSPGDTISRRQEEADLATRLSAAEPIPSGDPYAGISKNAKSGVTKTLLTNWNKRAEIRRYSGYTWIPNHQKQHFRDVKHARSALGETWYLKG